MGRVSRAEFLVDAPNTVQDVGAAGKPSRVANLDNPAGRLRYWLEQVSTWPNKDEALVVAACGVLGQDANTTEGRVAVMRLGTMLADLCGDVKVDVAHLPDFLHPDLLMADFAQIEAAVDDFTLSRQTPVKNMLTRIDPAGHRGLELLDTYLHTHRPQQWIDEEIRESLIAQVRDLIDGITEDHDLAADVKLFVLRRLVEVETKLRQALLTGGPGIEHATDALIGAMHRRPDMWDRVAETKWGPRLGKMAGALCLALGSVGGLPALSPGDEDQTPEIHNVDLDTNVTIPTQSDENEDIHDAEIVGEENEGSSAVPR